ncbi:MAG TPA: polyphosphate kinase 2 family protein [Candidatus Eisenbacteria bacterium]
MTKTGAGAKPKDDAARRKLRARRGLMDCERLRAKGGKSFRLSDHKTNDHRPFKDKEAADGYLQLGVARLAKLQDVLYAQDRWSVLLVIQAMDAAGKDGTIKHVMSGLNPQGCHVVSFKAPSPAELDHDFLWRCQQHLPERGRIGVFNRSYYEEVLVVRVHPEILAGQKLPPVLVTKNIWKERYEDINAAERYLVRNGTRIVKVFLHVSYEEQGRRMLARLEDPDKNWKFSAADLKERGYWKDYMKAYQEMIAATSTDWAPWHVVPADNKWFSRLAVADLLIDTLEGMDLQYPRVNAEKKKELEVIRKKMAAEVGGKSKA